MAGSLHSDAEIVADITGGSRPASEPDQAFDVGDTFQWGATLRFLPSILETDYWQGSEAGRLQILDQTASLGYALIWTAAYLNGAPPYLLIWVATAAIQLALLWVRPAAWKQQRHLWLCGLQIVRTLAQAAALSQVQEPLTAGSLWGLVQSRVLHHCLLVLLYQVPILYHTPWLAVSAGSALLTCMRLVPGGLAAVSPAALAAGSMAPSLEDAAAPSSSAAAVAAAWDARGLRLLLAPAGIAAQVVRWLGDTLPELRQLPLGSQLPQQQMLACLVYWHLFGMALLPLYIAYCMEWAYKLQCLLQHPQLAGLRTQLVSATAAVMHTSRLLGLGVACVWLVCLAAASWGLSSVVASALTVTAGT
jgi:hypothetical protein